MASGTQDDPVYMAVIPGEISRAAMVKQIALSVLVSAVPIGVAILMQRPALRQQIIMRMAHTVKIYALKESDMWADIAARAATIYQRARM